MGFFGVKPGVRTLNQQLRDAGYLISLFGKAAHLRPWDQFCFDVKDDTISRRPTKLAEATRSFLCKAREESCPFFYNVNCYDPHRPFIGMKGPDDLAGGDTPSRYIKTEEITEVPFADAFAHRDNQDLVPAVIEKMKKQYEGKKDQTLKNFRYGPKIDSARSAGFSRRVPGYSALWL